MNFQFQLATKLFIIFSPNWCIFFTKTHKKKHNLIWHCEMLLLHVITFTLMNSQMVYYPRFAGQVSLFYRLIIVIYLFLLIWILFTLSACIFFTGWRSNRQSNDIHATFFQLTKAGFVFRCEGLRTRWLRCHSHTKLNRLSNVCIGLARKGNGIHHSKPGLHTSRNQTPTKQFQS